MSPGPFREMNLPFKSANPPIYPLAALVGQESMLEALLILAVDPSLGGLLLLGEKGTAKSTAARALAEIMPPPPGGLQGSPRLESGQKSGCSTPFRTLPLGITEDRLLGGLDWEGSLRAGRPLLQPGLLGEAHGGLLYIDEVNLLETSLAHLLLDAVAAGQVVLERDGLSASYPAQVALLATMNPEEGQLGPQLADRFALTVEVRGESDPARRREVVRRRLAFEADPRAFIRAYSEKTAGLKRKIVEGRRLLSEVKISEGARRLMSRLALADRLSGHRGDLALAKAARALVALAGRSEVQPGDVLAVAGLVLPSRRRPAPPARPTQVQVERLDPAQDRNSSLFEPIYVAEAPEIPPDVRDRPEDGDRESPVRVFKSAENFNLITPKSRGEIGPRERSGRRSSRESLKAVGRSYRTTARRLGRPLSLAATLRAAAPYQRTRRQGRLPGAVARPVILNPADFREKVYRRKTGRLVVFVVDSSGSIGTLYRMEEAKAAALALLAEAYQKRDRVALIAFYGRQAELLLPPTNSPDLAARLLAELPSGGKTPLAAALHLTQKLLKVEQAKDPAVNPHIVLMTDGRPNIPLTPGANPWREALSLAGFLAEDPKLRFLLIDTDRGAYNDYKLTRDLAERLRAPRINLEELRAGRLESWLAEGRK